MRASLRRFVPRWVRGRDRALFEAVAAFDAPLLDALLPRMGRAADSSRLWLAVAFALGLSGDRFARRAAMRGLLAVAVASPLVNLPAKLLVRRPRPPLDVVPSVRRLALVPGSWSLPSGHAASATAFATAVALERPALGLPVGLLATGVSLSRVYTGAHYPADVAAGAFVGALAAAATTRWWPLVPAGGAGPRAALHRGHTPALPEGDGLVCAVNRDAGALWSPGRRGAAQLGIWLDPVATVKAHLPRATVRVCSGADLPEVLEAAAGEARALGVAGGDGSANAAAEIAHRRGLPLLLLPTGTFNHLARDLGIDAPRDALGAVKRGEVVAVDLATIAGRPFLNAASFGGYASMVRIRSRLEARLGKWPALLAGLARTLAAGEPVRVEIDGVPRSVWMAFVGNCRYHPAGFVPARRTRLDDALLDVRLVEAEVPWGRTRLLASVLANRVARCRAYDESTAASVTVRSLQGPLPLVRDGEAFDGPDAFEIRKVPRSLAVFAPVRR